MTFLTGKNGTYKKPTKLDLLKYEPNLPTTIITSRTELLTDVKIANVGSEVSKHFNVNIPSSKLNGFTLELNTCSLKTVKISLELYLLQV